MDEILHVLEAPEGTAVQQRSGSTCDRSVLEAEENPGTQTNSGSLGEPLGTLKIPENSSSISCAPRWKLGMSHHRHLAPRNLAIICLGAYDHGGKLSKALLAPQYSQS